MAEHGVESRAGPCLLTVPVHHQLTVSELRPRPSRSAFSGLAADAIVRGAERTDTSSSSPIKWRPSGRATAS